MRKLKLKRDTLMRLDDLRKGLDNIISDAEMSDYRR